MITIRCDQQAGKTSTDNYMYKYFNIIIQWQTNIIYLFVLAIQQVDYNKMSSVGWDQLEQIIICISILI